MATPRGGGGWQEQMQKKDAKKSGVEWTNAACDFVIVASADRPFGVGFPKQVNKDALEQLKAIRSPSDNWTYWCNWLREEKYWAHLLYSDHPGFMTLEQFLGTDGWAILENNSSLVRSVRFVKDTLHGERISEEQATRLNSNFWPVRPAPPVEPPPEEEAPATDPGPKRRRRSVLADSDDEEAPAPAPAPAASSRSARSNRAGKAVVGRICAQHPDRAQNLNPHRRMRQRIARRLSGTLRVRRSCSLLQAKQYYVLLEIRSGYQFQPRSYAQIKHQKWKRSDYADAVLWRLCLDTAADAVHVAFKLLRALPLLSAQLHAEDLF